MATEVRRPMPSTLAIRSSRVERSRCSRNGGDQLLELGLQEPLEPVDLLLPELPDTLVPARLTTGLDLGDILRELLDHRQTLGQRRQTRIWRFVDVRGCGRAA